jgi:hypothetical protein
VPPLDASRSWLRVGPNGFQRGSINSLTETTHRRPSQRSTLCPSWFVRRAPVGYQTFRLSAETDLRHTTNVIEV